MERSQVDAIAKAILEPDLKAQEELTRKRALDAAKLSLQRRAARFGLVGFAIGAAVGYFAFNKIFPYGLAGLFMAVLVGRYLPHQPAA